MTSWLRRVVKITAAGAIAALLAMSAAAQPTRAAADEIQILLAAMEQSGCEFYRNGGWHTAADARAHLTRKLARVEKGQPLRSAGEFIDAVATRSSSSGEPYRVRCPGSAPVASATWFRQALQRSRQATLPTR
jgi:hypothetical protein